jgi:hypothetical protein
MADQQEINDEWENIKTAMIGSAKKQFSYKKCLQKMDGEMKSVDKALNKRI